MLVRTRPAQHESTELPGGGSWTSSWARVSSPLYLLPRYGNRHGMVAGATGTGKTVSLLVMAESFSRLGVPVFRPT
jgi:Cdc6-like AAA superfamily ATPase